ncbi:hypothetical protein G4V62_04590 [Bacillaceae bacterium SIJ1]|uniref:hypothetical protein n=1 Tax=Litoribacterium kuwaitense TaxID=1398745 RepID=UPI0013EDFDA7|nr:hypothetical protein [Litoribacterium kuwaitense]NGP44264.1 hypothetical protein [Litoribacterium kuwaitense]
MKYVFKLNVMSVLYALMIFIPIELTGNVYRITRLTNIGFGTVNLLLWLTIIVGTVFLFFLTRKWLDRRKANYWTALLWIPYVLLFMRVFVSLFPITNPGDAPNPASGLILLGGLFVYPFYILILNFFAMSADDKPLKQPHNNA